MAAESEGGSAEAYRSDKASVSGGDSGDASASLEQEVDNTATTTQDSSADDNLLVNQNEFGDDIAIVDQDNEAEQDAANIGLQEQEQDLTQEAANVDINVNVAEQVIQTPTPTQPPDDGEDGVFCFAFEGDVGFAQAFCFETRAECEEGRVVTENRPPFTPTQECREFATIPPGGGNCRVVGDEVQCDPV